MEYKGKKILVVGFERTGQAVCDFMHARGAEIRVSEKKPESALGAKISDWKAKGVLFETGGHTPDWFLSADMIVPSPGVPPLPVISQAAAKGIPVVSEIELAFRHIKGKIIGITGSNGKSTTTVLTWKILKEAGLRARLAGNIGTPLITHVDDSRDGDIFVTEISSFQLEYVDSFRPAVAAFLNLSPNHIDWHETYNGYVKAKKKLFRRLGPGDSAILNRDDRLVWSFAPEISARLYAFSRKTRPRRGAFLEKGRLIIRDGKSRDSIPTSSIRLPGAHNLENVMAAAVMARLSGVNGESIKRSIMAFPGLEHRLEKVTTFGRVLFVNDSKATTIDATLKALASFNRPAVLILGGRDKGADFGLLRKHMKNKVRATVILGEAAGKIEAALKGAVPIHKVNDYRQAVRTSFDLARPGDVVLLAPACTSWDMFRNFEERGRTFKREVRLLARLKTTKGKR